MSNPWTRPLPTGPERDVDETPPEPAQPPVAAARLADVAQPGIELAAREDRLTVRVVDDVDAAPVWWVGAHGGAGETTLAQLVDGSRTAGRSWPISSDDQRRAHVVLVARTHAAGLCAAQRATSEWAAGGLPVDLLGLVLIADAPRRLPRPLRELAELVAGGAPRVWQLPWVEAWRQGEPVDHDLAPKAFANFLIDLRGVIDAAATPE